MPYPNVTVDEDITDRLYIRSNQTIVIQLPYSLMYNMGQRDFVPQEGISRSAAVDEYSFQIEIRAGQRYTFQTTPDPFAFCPLSGFVYCDFIKYNFVGDKSEPLLKEFPLEATNRRNFYVTYSTQNPEYHPLSKFDLSTVQFALRDVTGAPLPFKDKQSNVIITILLRKKTNYMFPQMISRQ